MKLRFLTLALAATLSACAAQATKDAPAEPPPAGASSSGPASAPTVGRDDVNAVVWMQTATEYEALSRQAFRAARVEVKNAVEHLEFFKTLPPAEGAMRTTVEQAALQQRTWNAIPNEERTGPDAADEPLAVIVDVDETIIDNSPFQARNIRDGVTYERERWNAWSNEARARALPGAVEFAQFLEQNGVKLFYVTNREAKLADATFANLKALGFPVPDDRSTLLMRDDAKGWTGEKGSRRKFVDQDHRVVLMMGDNLGDFVDGVYTDVDARRALVGPYEDWWGERWIMLPNPAYGSWEAAVNQHCKGGARPVDQRACKLSHLRAE